MTDMYIPVSYSFDEVKSIIDGHSNQLALTLSRSDASSEVVASVEDVVLYLHIIHCHQPHYRKINPTNIHSSSSHDVELFFIVDQRTLGSEDYRSIRVGSAVDFVGASVLSYVLDYKGHKKPCFHEFSPENGLTGRLRWRPIHELPREGMQ